jgi:ATP-dependent HslUV protease ATP-binding subunit HslU
MATESVSLQFTDDAVKRLAQVAWQVNERVENIGARRLHTVLERLLDGVLFEAPDMGGQSVTFDAERVRERLAGIAGDRDLARFVL